MGKSNNISFTQVVQCCVTSKRQMSEDSRCRLLCMGGGLKWSERLSRIRSCFLTVGPSPLRTSRGPSTLKTEFDLFVRIRGEKRKRNQCQGHGIVSLCVLHIESWAAKGLRQWIYYYLFDKVIASGSCLILVGVEMDVLEQQESNNRAVIHPYSQY